MIRYKRNTAGLIQIISKVDMKKRYGTSPDTFDAFALTFAVTLDTTKTEREEKRRAKRMYYDPVTMEIHYHDPLLDRTR